MNKNLILDGRMSIYKQYMVLHAFVNGYEVSE